jgi:hypothetical protein
MRLLAARPDHVTIYRGTVSAAPDSGQYGISWTLNSHRARWFATDHGRFRNTESPPVLLSTIVARDSICGIILARNESEVSVCPDTLLDIRCHALSNLHGMWFGF